MVEVRHTLNLQVAGYGNPPCCSCRGGGGVKRSAASFWTMACLWIERPESCKFQERRVQSVAATVNRGVLDAHGFGSFIANLRPAEHLDINVRSHDPEVSPLCDSTQNLSMLLCVMLLLVLPVDKTGACKGSCAQQYHCSGNENEIELKDG